MKLNLQQFAGSLTVTVMKDDNSHWTTASASPASSLAQGDTVTLTVTPASGYELDEIEVIAGGNIGIYDDDGTYKFDMGSSNVTLFFKAKSKSSYKVVENTMISVNGVITEITRDMTIQYGVNGAIVGVKSDGTPLGSLSADIIDALLKTGAIAPIEPAQKLVPAPETSEN